MNIVFVSNFFNHYQSPLSDELFSLCEGKYWFVETETMPTERRKSGFPFIDRNYLVRAWESETDYRKAMDLCRNADVMIASSEIKTLPFKKKRLKSSKLTFEYSERPLKKGLLNLFSKTNLVNQFYYHTLFYNKPFYKLCAGAYVANDQYAMHSFRNKCFKFGYFPEVDAISIDEKAVPSDTVKLLWCARFLKWKHPEMMVELAQKLRMNGIKVEISMIGSGALFNEIQRQVNDRNLMSVIHLVGNVSNEKVHELMRSHDIFVLTSDKREGWGVVVNEAMANGSCVVCSDAVGCAPYLIMDKENGLLFRSEDISSLYKHVMWAIEHPDSRKTICTSAFKTIKEEWSPSNAAHNLFQLCSDLLVGRKSSIKDGPCSKATPLKYFNEYSD